MASGGFLSSFMESAKNNLYAYTENQRAVRLATDYSNTEPTKAQLYDIAKKTFNFDDCKEVLATLFDRLNEDQHQAKYKAMVVLEYCVQNGSDRVIQELRRNVWLLRTLQNYKARDQWGKDVGHKVRKKATELTELLSTEKENREEKLRQAEAVERSASYDAQRRGSKEMGARHTVAGTKDYDRPTPAKPMDRRRSVNDEDDNRGRRTGYDRAPQNDRSGSSEDELPRAKSPPRQVRKGSKGKADDLAAAVKGVRLDAAPVAHDDDGFGDFEANPGPSQPAAAPSNHADLLDIFGSGPAQQPAVPAGVYVPQQQPVFVPQPVQAMNMPQPVMGMAPAPAWPPAATPVAPVQQPQNNAPYGGLVNLDALGPSWAQPKAAGGVAMNNMQRGIAPMVSKTASTGSLKK